MNETEHIFLITSTVNQTPGASPETIEVPTTSQVNLENVEDFKNVCRTCATVTEFLMPIFEGEGLQNHLADKIHKHLPIQVTEQDSLPRAVCYQCAQTLLACHELAVCCARADAALRAHLASVHAGALELTQHTGLEEQKSTINEEDLSFKHEQQKEFKVSAEPPPYEAAESQPACDSYPPEHPQLTYDDHLIGAHSDRRLQCDECNTHVARKDFLRHMTLHAVQYASDLDRREHARKRKKMAKDENENKVRSGRSKEPVDEQVPTAQIEHEKIMPASDNQENEFSDHSDMEFNFGPLPESVFEAIEDTRDSAAPGTPRADEPVVLAPKQKGKLKRNRVRTCPMCEKVYTAASSYFYHIKHFHKGTKEYECKVCERKFATKGCLVQHGSLHTGEFAFQCRVCERKFRTRASLYIHEQIHTGIKTHACSQCDMSFRWRAQLARHAQRHSAEKLYTCGSCTRAFNVRGDMLRHARTHQPAQHRCHCGVTFAQERYLKVHVSRKHAKVAEKQPDPVPEPVPSY